MNNKSKLSSFLKWLIGIATVVITSVIVWFFTHPGGVLDPMPTEPTIIEISGVWHTPMKDLSYNIIQNENQFEWIIRKNGTSGQGKIEGNMLTMIINNSKVIYNVVEWDDKKNPTVLFTTNKNFMNVILFRSCDDFKKFRINLINTYPDWKPIVDNYIKSLKNATCLE